MDKKPLTIFWFRRDLRLHDNAGLYRALKSGNPVLCLFIFDKEILDDLEDKDDARVTFIYNQIEKIDKDLQKHGSSLLLKYDKPEQAWKEIIKDYDVAAVYTNHDYEPYAKKRDGDLADFFAKNHIEFKTFKDQVILEGQEVVKDDKTPYTVFTPYKKKWLNNLTSFHLKSYPTEKYFKALYKTNPLKDISLEQMGFKKSEAEFPPH
jgi:deoxyribodipyrimidine photo-lyase